VPGLSLATTSVPDAHPTRLAQASAVAAAPLMRVSSGALFLAVLAARATHATPYSRTVLRATARLSESCFDIVEHLHF
jgi:hypothetical protein